MQILFYSLELLQMHETQSQYIQELLQNRLLIFWPTALLEDIEYQPPQRLAPTFLFYAPQTRINCKSIEQTTTDQ